VTVEAVLSAPEQTGDPSNSRAWSQTIALVLAIAGFSLCCVSILAWLEVRSTSGGRVPALFLSDAFWWLTRLTGFLGFWCALVGLVVGVGNHVTRRRRGRTTPWTPLVLVLSALALAFMVGSMWLAHQPPYFREGPQRPSRTELDALTPREVVRTYFTSQDLGVEYWLDDAASRAFWHESNAVPDLSLLGGAADLRIAPLSGGSDPTDLSDATHRSFLVRYRSHAPDSVGDPPGAQIMTVHLVRGPGGPWRVSYWGDGI
jgi:hypothetical protein